jgi:proteic killer suppression protein
MDVIFATEELEELWLYGKTLKGKPKYDSDIIKQYQKRIVQLKKSPHLGYIDRINSLELEELKGDKKGTYSIRVNQKYRIEFKVNKGTKNVTICNVIKLSNHYKR